MEREALLTSVTAALGDRRLVWSGLRGDDVEPIADLPQLTAAYSMIGPYRRRASIDGVAFEELLGTRPDMEVWDIDDHLRSPEAADFRRAHLRTLSQESALLTYRPSRFLSAIWFARRDRCLNLGLFGAHQAAFEHKPWVETSLHALGVPTIPWTYVADEDQLTTRDLLREGPVVLRRSRTSGGEGIVLVDDMEHLVSEWPVAEEAFASVAPFYKAALPINVGATVWGDGVTVHHPSVQLIGIPDCVTRPFGYCGNDFNLVKDLPNAVIDEIERLTLVVGRWLATFGYRGTFGVDYLLDGDDLLFTEINPRFQGSTHASCRLSVEAGEACLMLEHLAAMLGLDAPPGVPLRDQVADMAPLAHLVIHWTGEAQQVDPGELTRALLVHPAAAGVDVSTRTEVVTDPGSVVTRLTVRTRLTDTGFELREPWRSIVNRWSTTTKQDCSTAARKD